MISEPTLNGTNSSYPENARDYYDLKDLRIKTIYAIWVDELLTKLGEDHDELALQHTRFHCNVSQWNDDMLEKRPQKMVKELWKTYEIYSQGKKLTKRMEETAEIIRELENNPKIKEVRRRIEEAELEKQRLEQEKAVTEQEEIFIKQNEKTVNQIFKNYSNGQFSNDYIYEENFEKNQEENSKQNFNQKFLNSNSSYKSEENPNLQIDNNTKGPKETKNDSINSKRQETKWNEKLDDVIDRLIQQGQEQDNTRDSDESKEETTEIEEWFEEQIKKNEIFEKQLQNPETKNWESQTKNKEKQTHENRSQSKVDNTNYKWQRKQEKTEKEKQKGVTEKSQTTKKVKFHEDQFRQEKENFAQRLRSTVEDIKREKEQRNENETDSEYYSNLDDQTQSEEDIETHSDNEQSSFESHSDNYADIELENLKRKKISQARYQRKERDNPEIDEQSETSEENQLCTNQEEYKKQFKTWIEKQKQKKNPP